MNAKSLLMKLYFSVNEKTYKGKVKYLFQKHKSKTLAIIFSGFSEKPVYNYVKTLKNWKVDKLFILDDFAYRGSYYWFSNGSKEPMVLIQSLVDQFSNSEKYDKVVALGSSKGGTCAIYYGLTAGMDEVYAAACQYHVGSYVNTAEDNRIKVFKSMMGSDAGVAEQQILDAIMPKLFEEKAGSRTQIHLMYSKNEHTYIDHIKDMITDMDRHHINHDDRIETFQEHGEVGKFFIPWIKEELNIE